MSKRLRKQFDVLVVGGGPAGMAAAACAAECGRHVGIVDDNPNLGGQIWRRETTNPTSEAAKWAARLRVAGVEVLAGTRVFHHPEPGTLLAETAAETSDDLYALPYEKLVLATGAREGFLPFPGWTLPRVMGAGGLQAFVKCGLPISGKRVVVAGSGPLLIAVAAYLRQHGAEIAMICEQASWTSLARFGIALLGQPQKLRQGLSLRKDLSGVPFHANSWPTSAEGREALKAVNIRRRHKIEKVSCDYLACGFHLLPNTELAALLGCRILQEFVQVNELQQTSVPGVYCAGEPTGIGGVELSLVEGQIAGFAAAGRSESAKELFHSRAKLQKFAKVLNRIFSPRAELKSLPHPETVVCRCEDASYGRLQHHTSWRAAKLQTRCGMGPCQGRICGPATQFLFGWRPDSVRPPIFPTRFENLAVTAKHSEPEHAQVTGESQ